VSGWVDPTRVFFEQSDEVAADEVPEEPADATPMDSPELFSIPAIKEWVGEHPADAQAILDAERSRRQQARRTLVEWLESQTG
jgi:hypothetical protein